MSDQDIIQRPKKVMPISPGRPKGSPNKTTALLKDAVLLAAERAGKTEEGDKEGLVKYLQTQAIANPGPFLSLLGKVLPLQIVGDPDNPLHTIVRVELVAPKT
jgi:hypothetical protein